MTKRQLGKRVAVTALIVVALTATFGFFMLRSKAFHQYVLAIVVNRAEQATGGKIRIGDFTFHLDGLRVDLYRIAIHGTEPYFAPPLLWIDHIEVDLKIISLFGRQVGLQSVEVDHPVVHITVDANGRSNLPSPPLSRQPTGSTNLFSLAIKHFVLRRGQIDANDRHVALEAELQRLQAQIDFNPRTAEYQGSLRYPSGEIQLGRFKPVLHSVDLDFSASSAHIRLEPLIILSGNSRISVQGAIKNYNHPSATGSYSVELATADIARVLNSAIGPAGEISTTASFNYQSASNRALLDSLSLSGLISSPSLSVRAREARGLIAGIRGRYSLEHGNLTVSGLQASVLGGRFAADFAIRNLSGPARGSLSASARSISLAALGAALPNIRWAKFPIRGNLSATTTASWQGNLAGLRTHSDATIDAALGPFRTQQQAQSTPVQGALHVTYDGRVNTLIFQQSVLHTPQSEVRLNGSLGDHNALAIVTRSRDLHATDILMTQVRRFASSAPNSVRPLGISGSALFQGTIQGTLRRPTLTGMFTANGVRVQQAAFPHFQTQLVVSSSQLSLSGGQLEAAHGIAQFQASVGLRKWTYNPSVPASLQLSARNMSVADLATLAQMKYPVDGILSAEVSIHGSPSHPVGAGTVQIVKGEVWKQPIRSMILRFNGTGNAMQSALSVQTPAGKADARLTYSPQRQAYDGEVSLEGVHLERLHAFEQALAPVSGVVTASIRGRGTLKAPQAQASLSIPTLRIGHQTITGVSSQAAIANRIATFTLNSSFSGSPAHMNGTVRLNDDYQTDVKVSTGTINAGPLLAAYWPGTPDALQCRTELHAWLRGPLKEPSRIAAQLQIPTFRLAYQSLQLSTVSAITANYHAGTLVLNPVEMKGTESDFRLQAMIPLKSNEPIKASARGTIDLRLVQMIHPDWASSGQLQVSLDASGSRSHPEIQGQVQVVNAAVEPANAPIGVYNMNATISLRNSRAEITKFSAQSGGGSIVASGSVAYAQGAVFSLVLNATHVRVRYPEGVREVLNSRLTLFGTPNSAVIAGEVSIDQLSLTPSFDLVSFANQFNVMSVPSGEPTGFTHHVKLNVALVSARELSLSGTELHLTGTANLRVEGSLADPVIVGRTTLSGGELFFNERRYQVQSGVIDFLNSVSTQPVVNLQVVTTIDQYTITLNFTGPFDRMRTTYSSDPSLSQADIIHLLVTGQGAESASTSLGAQSIVAQGVASQVSSQVQKLTGISSLTIDPQMGGNGSNPGARVAVQQRVTSKLLFTFSVDTSTTQDDAVQVEYQVNRRWSVQALRDQAGGYSFEIRSHKKF